MQSKRSLLWAELSRDHEVVLVPSTAWEAAIFARGRSERREADSWDDKTKSWQVSRVQAEIFLEAIERLPADFFSQSMGSQDFGPFAVGTVEGQAIHPAEAQVVKRQTMDFLRAGSFRWRFISL